VRGRREDRRCAVFQRLRIKKLSEDVHVCTYVGSKFINVRIHVRMSVMVWAELPGAEASRRSSPVKGYRRPRRLA
jgi:hypothetical protein